MLNWHMFLLPEDYWEIKKTKTKGRGVFARKSIPEGTLVGDYLGKLIRLENIDFDEEKKKLFLMYYDDRIGIYPDLRKPGVHLINHSCSPNCWLIRHKNHTIIFALKNISKGEELTISYLLPPKMNCDPCNHQCFCKSVSCKGSMHLTDAGYKQWQEFQDKVDSKDEPKRDIIASELKPLKKYPTIPKKLISQIKTLQRELYR